MWEKTIRGIVLANLDTLACYQKNKTPFLGKNIYLFTKRGIQDLPFFFKIPLKLYLTILGPFCLLTTSNSISSSNPKKRLGALKRIRLPFFGVLNKLVRSLIFLRLFDLINLEDE